MSEVDESRTVSPASFSLPIRPSENSLQSASSNQSNGIQTHLLKFYSTMSFGEKVWSCQVCKKRATGLFHCSISKLFPFASRIYDIVIPVCNSSKCNSEGIDLADDFVRMGGLGEETSKCENCSEKSRMKLCATCRFGPTLRGGEVFTSRGSVRPRQRGRQTLASASLDSGTTSKGIGGQGT